MAYVHDLVKQALRRGELTRPLTCEACGMIRAVWGHHDDYLKPLEVRWLCKPCHQEWHRVNGPGANAEAAELIPRRYSVNDSRRPEMVQLLDAGWTLQKIGDKYGLTRERVRQITIGYKRAKASLQEIADAKRDEINALRRQGRTRKEIAALLGINSKVFALLGDDLAVKELVHGTVQGYRRGCRCALCEPQNRLAVKAVQKRMLEQGRCTICCKPSGGKRKCRECYLKWYAKYGRQGQPGAIPGQGFPLGKSGVRGISWQKRSQRWHVYEYVNRKQVYYGSFKDLEEAKSFKKSLQQKGQAA